MIQSIPGKWWLIISIFQALKFERCRTSETDLAMLSKGA